MMMTRSIRQQTDRGWWLIGLLSVATRVYNGAQAVPLPTGMFSQTVVLAPVAWPIDTKVDTVLSVINIPRFIGNPSAKPEQKRRQRQLATLFAPGGYFLIHSASGGEQRVSASQFLAHLNRAKGTHYQLQSVSVIHFQDVSRNQRGQYSSRAVIYFDVNRFANHLPVTQSLSRVTMPLAQPPPATDYWQIYELNVVAVSNSVTAAPR